MVSNTVLMDTGMKCLIDTLGEVGAERFICQLIREPFDYTKWQMNMFENMSVEDIAYAATTYCENNPRLS